MSQELTAAVTRAIKRMDPALTLKMSSILANEIAETFLPLNRDVYNLLKKAGRISENLDLADIAKSDRNQLNELMKLAGLALQNASENLFKIAQSTAQQYQPEQAALIKKLREADPEGQLKIDANSADGQALLKMQNHLARLNQQAELYRLAQSHNEMVRYVAVELPLTADRRIGFKLDQDPPDFSGNIDARLATDPRSTALLMGQLSAVAAGRVQAFASANPKDEAAAKLLQETLGVARHIQSIGSEGMKQLAGDQVVKLLAATSRQMGDIGQFARNRGLAGLGDFARAAAWHAGVFVDGDPDIAFADVTGKPLQIKPPGNDGDGPNQQTPSQPKPSRHSKM